MNLKRFFGRRHTPTIDDITFDTFGWNLVDDFPQKKTWINARRSATVSIQFNSERPTLPGHPDDIQVFRQHFRTIYAQQVDGGLIRCETVHLKGCTGVEVITKQPNQPSGMVYGGQLLLPFASCCFTILLQAVEVGPTGMREAMVMDRWLKKLHAKGGDPSDHFNGYSADPYDKDFREGHLMNYAERLEFDDEFPDHPLTVVRSKMQSIKSSISFAERIKQLKPFRFQ